MSLACPDIAFYDGERIPVRSASVDLVLLIEVLEHVNERNQLLIEICRVLTRDGVAIISTPWSARIHYAPHDYFRPTPFEIYRLATESGLTMIEVIPRGSTAAVIANKLAIAPLTALKARRSIAVIFVLMTPLIAVLHVIGLLQIALGVANPSDPLGFTFKLKKISPRLEVELQDRLHKQISGRD